LPEDRTRAEEPDPGHDLRRDPGRVERLALDADRARQRRRGEQAERDVERADVGGDV
jgi:hypothetical protein